MNHFKKLLYLIALVGFSSAFAGSYEDFFRAVEQDNGTGVRALLQRGFDGNSRDPSGQTALYLSLRAGSSQVVNALVESPGVDVDLANEAGETPLMMAALKGETVWVQRLLDRGAKWHRPGWSPLHYAATGPQTAIVKLLLDRGAPVDAESPNRSTPLMMAAQYGNEASVDLLLSRGADPRRRNDREFTAADFARLAEREALAQRLERLAR